VDVVHGTSISAYFDMTDLGGGWTEVLDQDLNVAPGYESKTSWAGVTAA
jgi:hypothetical protein